MQGQRSHGDAYYRCRFPQEYALANKIQHPRNVYLREEALIVPLDRWLSQALSPTRREHTIAALAEHAAVGLPAPTPATDDSIIAQNDAKIERYRAALDAGADPGLVAGWISETQAERQRALARSRAIPQSPHEVGHLSAEDIGAILDELGDLITALGEAEPDHKLEVYRGLGLHLTYHQETQTVRATIDLGEHRWDLVRVRGPTLWTSTQ